MSEETGLRSSIRASLRILLWLDFSLNLGLLVLDFGRYGDGAGLEARSAYVAEMFWGLSWIGVSYSSMWPARERWAAVVAVFGVHALQLLAGLSIDNVAASAILCAGSALIAAFILPWGASTQLVSAALAGVALLIQAGVASGALPDPIAPQLALPLAVLALSVWIAIVADRRARVEQEMRRALRVAHEELELRVERRTAELLIAKDIAERANRARHNLIAHTSHDLRTPINVIWGYKDMLLDGHLSDEQRDFVLRIGRAAKQLRRLSDDLLDLSRADAGKIKIRKRTFSLSEVMAHSVDLFEKEALSRGLRLHCEIAPAVPDLLAGDQDRLGQILTNLIENALKFTIEGEIRVCVTSDAEALGARAHPDADPVRVLFEVVDTGVGLAAEDQARVFEAFAQVESSHSDGSGLGLAICRQLVDLMGGRIGVRSEPHRGSTFWFELPLLVVTTQLRAEAAAGDVG